MLQSIGSRRVRCEWVTQQQQQDGNRIEGPQKIEVELPYDPATSLMKAYLREMNQYLEEIAVLLFIAAVFTIMKIWKQISVHGWIVKKTWRINTVGCYSAMNKKEIRAFIKTHTNLKDIILSTIRQTQKDKYCILLLICRIENDQTHRNGE